MDAGFAQIAIVWLIMDIGGLRPTGGKMLRNRKAGVEGWWWW